MALTAPAVGPKRFENQLAAHTPFTLKANQPLQVRAIIIGGSGETVVPAMQKYVELRGLPQIPEFKGGFDTAVTLLAYGWLDSAVNEGGLFRHAVWGNSFGAGPAADAIMYMDWLANQMPDRNLAERLIQGRDLAVSKIPPGQPYSSAVSHTRTPTAPFVFGSLDTYVEQRKAEAQNLLKGFDEKGIKLYRPGKVDYGKTHFVRHANGLAGAEVVRILEAATLCADPMLIERGLALLDRCLDPAEGAASAEVTKAREDALALLGMRPGRRAGAADAALDQAETLWRLAIGTCPFLRDSDPIMARVMDLVAEGEATR